MSPPLGLMLDLYIWEYLKISMGENAYAKRTVAFDLATGALGLLVILSLLFFPIATTEFISDIPFFDAGAYATNVLFFGYLAVALIFGLIFVLFILAILGANSKKVQKFNQKVFPMLISDKITAFLMDSVNEFGHIMWAVLLSIILLGCIGIYFPLGNAIDENILVPVYVLFGTVIFVRSFRKHFYIFKNWPVIKELNVLWQAYCKWRTGN